ILKLKYHPLGVYFAKDLPEGKIRKQHNLLNRCIPKHALRAAKHGKMSVLQRNYGCLGVRWWSGFSKRAPKGLSLFLSQGHHSVFGGRKEKFKKTARDAAKLMKNPGPAKLPEGTEYNIFKRLKDIPDKQEIEHVLFLVRPLELAKLIGLANYAQDLPDLVKAPYGSGCMSLLTYPLLMEEDKPSAIVGIWDLFARRFLPKNILSLAFKRWFIEEIAKDIKDSFLTHKSPYTIRGEISHWLEKRKDKDDCFQNTNSS
ncbi:MAG: DUF169 domain-containing protein, partial [Candidatus Heimdallarchaeota archaeon]|nr:DUF169 domain-containing protein [Candidatus Heimdallarchaeota archaeon]